MLNSTELSTDLWETPFVTGLHLDIKPLMATLLSATIQPIPYPLSGPSIQSMSLQLREKDVTRVSVKWFGQIQVDAISCSSLILWLCNPSVEGHHIFQAQFALSEAMLAVINQLLIFHVLSHSFQEDLLHDLARHRDETDWPVVPQVLLFTLVYNGDYVFPFPVTGNFTGLLEGGRYIKKIFWFKI